MTSRGRRPGLGWLRQFVSLVNRGTQAGQFVMGINRRNADYVYPLNPRCHFPLADDKILAKQILADAGVPVPLSLGVVRGFFEVSRWSDWLSCRGDGVVKPSRGKGGSGVMVIQPGSDGAGDPRFLAPALRGHFGDILSGVFSGGVSDVAMIEERLIPHPGLARLWGPNLVDIRIILHRGEAIQAMLRVPTAASRGRSNLHAGGLGIAVGLSDGRTGGGFLAGRPVTEHPDTGGRLFGMQVPDWPLVIEIADRVSKGLPLGYLGVDIALDGARGPTVLEVNVRPGLEIQNVNDCGLISAMANLRR